MTGLDVFFRYSKKPLPYDAEVEYIESTGTQWIVTDTPGESGMTLGVDFLLTNINRSDGSLIFGIYDNATTEFIPVWKDGSTYTISYGYGKFVGIHSPVQLNVKNSVVAYFDVGVQRVELNGKVIGSENSQYKHTISAPLSLFATRNGKSTALQGTRIYNAFARIGNNMRMNLQPVRFTNEQNVSEGAMYDRVTKQLFRNKGTGAFVIGPDK